MNSNSKTKFEFKQWRRKTKQKKKRRKSLIAQLHAQVGQPAQPNYQPSPPLLPLRWPTRGCKQAWLDHARPTQPAHASPTPACLPASLAAAAAGPHPSAFPVHLLHATPQLPCDRRPTALAGAGQGVTPGAWPCSPLRRAHATSRHRRMHCMRLHRTMPITIGGIELRL